jgi:hypothetical protein
MPYNPLKPDPDDDLDVSVTDIQQNFLTANTVMGVDHFPFNNATVNAGKHNRVQLPVLAADPAAVLGQGILYSKVAGFGSDAQLFWRFASGARPPLQITGPDVLVAATGTVPLLAGMQIKWGLSNIAGASTAITFPLPFRNNCFSVIASLFATAGTNPQAQVLTVSVTQFTVQLVGPATGQIHWIAIGN